MIRTLLLMIVFFFLFFHYGFFFESKKNWPEPFPKSAFKYTEKLWSSDTHTEHYNYMVFFFDEFNQFTHNLSTGQVIELTEQPFHSTDSNDNWKPFEIFHAIVFNVIIIIFSPLSNHFTIQHYPERNTNKHTHTH